MTAPVIIIIIIVVLLFYYALLLFGFVAIGCCIPPVRLKPVFDQIRCWAVLLVEVMEY